MCVCPPDVAGLGRHGAGGLDQALTPSLTRNLITTATATATATPPLTLTLTRGGPQLLQFYTAYTNEHSILIYNLVKIRNRYLVSTKAGVKGQAIKWKGLGLHSGSGPA